MTSAPQHLPGAFRFALVLALAGISGCAQSSATTENSVPAGVTLTNSIAMSIQSSPVDTPVITASAPATTEPPPNRCGGGAPRQARTLRVWHTLNDSKLSFLSSVADQYEAANAEITIELVRVDGGATAVVEQLKQVSSDLAPDIVMGDNLSVRLLADSGQFVPVTACAAGSVPSSLRSLLPPIASTFSADGVLWAAPYNISTPLVMFDKRKWREAGLDPDQPPTNFDQLEAAIRALKDSGTTTTGIAIYDRSAGWLVQHNAAQRGLPLAGPANGRAGPIESVNLDVAGNADLLKRFQALKRDGYVEWMGWDTGPLGANDLLKLVDPISPSGMTFHTSASVQDIIELRDAGKIIDVEIGVAPMPGPPVGMVGGGAWWLWDSHDPDRVRAAWELVAWLTSPAQVADLAAKTSYIPTTAEAAASPVVQAAWKKNPILAVGYTQLAAADGSPESVGLQIGPGLEANREIELAAAYSIDVSDADPSAELARRSLTIADLDAAYQSSKD